MAEVSVKVKVKVSKGKEKKARKPRKDKGVKRSKGAKGTKNPQFQTGSIDFRTIGTSATTGVNLTKLAGLVSSSRAIAPLVSQPQMNVEEVISRELAKYTPRDLPKNVPPPQFRPDVSQGQEETPALSQTTQVRQAMGSKIERLRK